MASWSTVQDFQSIADPTPSQIIQLESAFNDILKQLESNRCHIEAGYSETFPRYVSEISEDDNHKKIVGKLRRHYWARHRQVEKLDRQIKERDRMIQSTCEHVWEKDWESRDHRSRYDCRKCGAYR